MKLEANVIYDKGLTDRPYVFFDRFEAGRRLGYFLSKLDTSIELVMAIPAGGVPVGMEVSKVLNTELNVAVVKKVLYPWTTEAGFGAVAWDGSVELDSLAINRAGLSAKDVKRQVDKAVKEVKRRYEELRRLLPEPEVKGKSVLVVDDGLATGYTTMLACKTIKKLGASKVMVGTPTGNPRALTLISPYVAFIACLNVRSTPLFAVADAYQNWRDLTEEEVKELIKQYVKS
jgi:predicted phosphoribosyltransferase